MLDALTPLPVALSSNASGWSKALAILIIAVGILALAATVYLMWKHRVFSSQPDAAEEGVIRTSASSVLYGFLYAIMGGLTLIVLMIDLVVNQLTNIPIVRISMFLNGLFFPIIALTSTHTGITIRIVYDECGIRQYWGLRNKSIQWSGLENVEYKRFGRMLLLCGGRAKMYVELRNPNAPRLLKFMEERVTGENRNTVEKLLHGKPHGKSV